MLKHAEALCLCPGTNKPLVEVYSSSWKGHKSSLDLTGCPCPNKCDFLTCGAGDVVKSSPERIFLISCTKAPGQTAICEAFSIFMVVYQCLSWLGGAVWIVEANASGFAWNWQPGSF